MSWLNILSGLFGGGGNQKVTGDQFRLVSFLLLLGTDGRLYSPLEQHSDVIPSVLLASRRITDWFQ